MLLFHFNKVGSVCMFFKWEHELECVYVVSVSA